MSETLKTVEQAPSTSDEAKNEQFENETPQSRLAAAEAAVAALSINSSANDHIYAKKGLQDAQEGMRSIGKFENETLVNEVPDYSKVDDLIKIGKNSDTFHRPDGKFLSRDELKAIYDNHEQIRDGIDASKDVKAEDDQMSGSENAAGVEEVIPGNPDHEQPALDGETFDEYEALNESAKIDVLEDVVLSPMSGEIDTLEGVVLSPVPGEQAPADDSSAKAPEQENTAEAGDDKLDEKEQSFWNKVSQRRQDLYSKAGAVYSTTLSAVGNSMPKPNRKLEETDDQFESRKRRYGAYKIVGVVALIAAYQASKYGLPLFHGVDDAGIVDNTSNHAGSGAKYSLLEHPPVVPVELTGPEFSSSAITVEDGGGWYAAFDKMGITNETEKANLLRDIGPKLERLHAAYPTKDGLWGVSHPGKLSNSVVELIKNSR